MTTPEFTTEAFAALGAPSLVYVRPVKARELIGATPVETVQGFAIDPEQTLYAVHRADGARLAVLGDYDAAVAAAIANDLAPVAVN
jgi:hypothetical protein